MFRADCPFKIVEKINDNAYKLELPPGSLGLVPHLTFHTYDLTWEKKMRFRRGQRQIKRGRMMRTSLCRIHSLLLLRYRDRLRHHEHNNYVVR
jgi:hypothetical protein